MFDIRRLQTVQLVPLTAFDASGRLNLEPMRVLTSRLVDAGISVFIPCAGSAEFHSLQSDEILAVVKMMREVVGDGLIIAPVGHQLETAIRLGRDAIDAGADALLAMPLTFPYLSNSGAADYYRGLFEATNAPTLLYKKAAIPSDTLLLELAASPQLIGVKYAVNDLDAFNSVVQADGKRIEWYCGSAERFAPFFALAGATGYTSGAGNICPRLTLAMHAALAAGEWQEALRIQRLILPIEHFRARDENSYNISFLKHAIRHTELDFGDVRPPQRKLTQGEIQEIDELIPVILQAENELSSEVSC